MLGELEKQIMDIIWQREHCCVRDILASLPPERKLAYTTIATILQRLFDKRLLVRKEAKVGYIYSPKVSKEKYSKNIASVFLKNFINSYGDIAIASFAESIDKLPEKKRNHLLKLLEGHDTSK